MSDYPTVDQSNAGPSSGRGCNNYMRLGALASVRLLVMLRRIWKSIDKLAEIEQSRLQLERDRLSLQYPAWGKAGGKVPKAPRLTEIGRATIESQNKRYLETHDAEE